MRAITPLFLSVLAAASLSAQSQVIQPTKAEKCVETRTFVFASGNRLQVRNVNGAVKVTPWDKEEVAFTGTFKPSSGDQHVKVRVDQGAKELILKAEQPREGWFRTTHASCEMEFRVPRRLAAHLETVNGSITLEGTEGAHELETVNGSVTVRGLKGSLEMETVNGGIRGEDLGGITSGLKASTVNGGVALQLGAIKGQLLASTVNGGVTFNAKGAEGIEVKRHKVRATFPGGGQEIKVSTVNGGITLN